MIDSILYKQSLIEYPVPSFQELSCSSDVTSRLCVKVDFPPSSETSDLLILKTRPETIYEGFLNKHKELGLVLLESAEDNTRMVRII